MGAAACDRPRGGRIGGAWGCWGGRRGPGHRAAQLAASLNSPAPPAPAVADEPLLADNPDRFVLFPIKWAAPPPHAPRAPAQPPASAPRCAAAHACSSDQPRPTTCRYRDIWEFYKRAEASFWTGAFEPRPGGSTQRWRRPTAAFAAGCRGRRPHPLQLAGGWAAWAGPRSSSSSPNGVTGWAGRQGTAACGRAGSAGPGGVQTLREAPSLPHRLPFLCPLWLSSACSRGGGPGQ